MQPPSVAAMPHTFRHADHLLGGDLAERLTNWRQANDRHSYEWISRELYRLTDGEIRITLSTVRNWLTMLEAEPVT